MATSTTEEKLNACCLTEYRPLPGTPNGQIIQVAALDTYYIAGKTDNAKDKVIVLLTDVFGLVKNPRIIADELSEKSGFDVYVPDILNGDPYPSSLMKVVPDVAGEKLSIGARLKCAGIVFISLNPWLIRHRQAVTVPIVEKFCKALRTEKNVSRIQVVGYCFGGLYALLAGGSLHLADTVVGCHISLTNKAHFEQLEVPTAIVCAQEDDQFPDSYREEAQRILARKSGIPNKFLLTKGTVHGFASRPNPENPLIMSAFKEANDLIAEWAKTHL